MMSGLTLQGVHKSFGDVQAVRDVSFDVASGEVLALLGPSGCGKSTILALIAGLERPDRGKIAWDGRSLQDIPPHQRGFGLMFQDYALFPHRDVYGNIAFGLQMERWSAEREQDRVKEMLELVGLPGYGGRDVNTLSGGEQQRIALARSLAPGPRLLMLDEPLGALDRNLRERLISDLGEILRHMRQTAIYVTHDQEEAFAVADRVAVMNGGRIEQLDSPQLIYSQPASTFVARFLGLTNLLEGVGRLTATGAVMETRAGEFTLDHPLLGPFTVLIRPDRVSIGSTGNNHLEGRLLGCSFRGSTCRATIEVGGVPLQFDFPASTPFPPPGGRVQLSFDPAETIQIFPVT